MSSNAEQMAAEFEKDGGPDMQNKGGKRTKSDGKDHKHVHPEGDSRKIVTNAQNGEANRKDQSK